MPEPTLRDQYAAAIRATWDGTTMHMDDAIRAETDAVMAVRDTAVEQLLATVARVQALADDLAAHAGFGVDLEADGIRRAIAERLHTALHPRVEPNDVPSASM